MELKIGFEIHQQLDTHKLFCSCPSLLEEDLGDIEVMRRLRVTQSELGEIDRAAREEFLKRKAIYYRSHPDTTCLVEFDEEPPHNPNDEAIDICLEIAILLNADIVDEVHFMRKLVIDGSNTAGFQRTAIIAMDGYLDTDEGGVGIPTICLEEEAARKVEDREDGVIYSLDRLGIPLIEIATSPDIHTPEQAREVAKRIGDMLRATGKVKRGIGTIRQDINVSIEGGARTEIKGVQDLNQIPKLIENEVKRQERLIGVKEELERRGIAEDDLDSKIYDVSDIFYNTRSKIIGKELEKGGKVLALKLKGFKGLFAERLGPEFAQYVKASSGVGGIFHIDELPAYGIAKGKVDGISKRLASKELDGFVLVAGEPERAKRALEAVFRRAMDALRGVPKETRVARPDGTTSYMRPLPGAARMYPETDIPPVVITEERVEEIKERLPEMYGEKTQRFVKEYQLSEELASQIVRSKYSDLFEEVAFESDISPSIIGNALIGTIKELTREGVVEIGRITNEKLKEMFQMVASERISKEAIPEILTALSKSPERDIGEVIEDLGIVTFGEDELRGMVRKILEERTVLIEDRKLDAMKPLMGVVMKEVRGRVDGKVVSEILKDELVRFIEVKGR
ncbi:MAG: Glu-tRNA(Gln) amidotransferase subunit GatE [Candidatus Hydrothermarchaeales archaeon]